MNNETLSKLFTSAFFQKAVDFSLLDALLTMLLAFAIGMFIAVLYRATYQGVMYTMTYGVTLVAMTMLSSMILLVVTSNVVLTLGMVGALSIIRFRTSVKEPLDIMYMFWAVGAGIAIGAGMAGIAIVGTVAVGLSVLFLTRGRQNGVPYILVLTLENRDAEQSALALVGKNVRRCRVKSKSVTKAGTELTVDIRLIKDNTDFMQDVSDLPGVLSAVLVTYNGEYMT